MATTITNWKGDMLMSLKLLRNGTDMSVPVSFVESSARILSIISASVTIMPDIMGERKYAWNFNDVKVSFNSSCTSSCVWCRFFTYMDIDSIASEAALAPFLADSEIVFITDFTSLDGWYLTERDSLSKI